MKDLDSFTVEQLNDFIKSDHAQCGDVAALARIALAAKRAEPVAYMRESHEGREYNGHNEFSGGGRGIALYTTPQLNSPEIPEGWKLVPIEPTDAMQVAAANAIRFDTTAINKLWTGKRVFDAMLAAAPEKP
ncbi:hypothetical protein FG466_000381 [Yersinia enterocolitica]|nr:hypothetical protein [Yersinia enterocolitica]